MISQQYSGSVNIRDISENFGYIKTLEIFTRREKHRIRDIRRSREDQNNAESSE